LLCAIRGANHSSLLLWERETATGSARRDYCNSYCVGKSIEFLFSRSNLGSAALILGSTPGWCLRKDVLKREQGVDNHSVTLGCDNIRCHRRESNSYRSVSPTSSAPSSP
jgi:hypothetical protein